jgi:uncharacterized protein (DUF1800 family)
LPRDQAAAYPPPVFQPNPTFCGGFRAGDLGRFDVTRWTVSLVLVISVLVLTGCATVEGIPGSGNLPGTSGPLPGTGVMVTPASATVRGGETQQFSASLQGSTAGGFAWSVNGVAGGNGTIGTISSSGLYTAPGSAPSPNTVNIQATSITDPNASGTSAVSLLNAVPILTDINPRTIGVGPVTIHLMGGRFASGALINFGTTTVPGTLISSTQLTATFTIPSTQTGNIAVTVSNPDPGAATSSALTALVTNQPQVSATSAARFLEQSTFGPTQESINQVQQVGFQNYLQDQFRAPMSTFADPPTTDDPGPLQRRFFTNALIGPDQLRQRVAFALHKIWVVSWVAVSRGDAFAPYLRMHQQHAFGNYRQIAEDVTLNAAMGTYQDIANNNKADPARGRNCNENYGRELMQLFTIGVWKLNQDGTFQRDAQNNLLATYDQPAVEGNACALTGWTFTKATPSTRDWPRPAFYGGPLEAVDSHHDTNAKLLLDGFVVPAGGTAAQDLQLTLDNLFQHQNVAPWVSRLLIQQLVSSNPSPAYIQRVANAFDTGSFGVFGNGQRGDMQALIAAILLDPEARRGDTLLPGDPAVQDDGKLKEPILFILNLLRATGATSDGSALIGRATNMGQRYLYPPTVFSYFPPDYKIPGTALFGPELQLHDTSTAFQRVNFVNSYVFGSLGSGTAFSLAPFSNLASNPSQLLDFLNVLMLRGKMTSAMRTSILNAVNAVPSGSGQNPNRARTAIYLIASSSQYQVQQ